MSKIVIGCAVFAAAFAAVLAVIYYVRNYFILDGPGMICTIDQRIAGEWICSENKDIKLSIEKDKLIYSDCRKAYSPEPYKIEADADGKYKIVRKDGERFAASPYFEICTYEAPDGSQKECIFDYCFSDTDKCFVKRHKFLFLKQNQ